MRETTEIRTFTYRNLRQATPAEIARRRAQDQAQARQTMGAPRQPYSHTLLKR